MRLLARSSGDHWALLNLARALAAPHDPGTRASLLSEVRSGGWWWALAAFSDVRDLPEDVAASLIPRLSVQVAQQISSAHAGLYAWGSVDYGRTLALLNARFPGHADWEPVYALLPDRAVAVDHKAGAMEVLAALAEDIPGEVRTRLGAIAKSIAQDQRPAARSRNGHKTTRGVAAHLATTLGPSMPRSPPNACSNCWLGHLTTGYGPSGWPAAPISRTTWACSSAYARHPNQT